MSFLLSYRHIYVTITGEFEHFQYFNFETSFVKNETFFEKLEHRF